MGFIISMKNANHLDLRYENQIFTTYQIIDDLWQKIIQTHTHMMILVLK